jgi:trehalose 6-phosphate phosphatase
MADAPPLPGGEDRWALFLDIDGTLVAIAETPQEVRVEPGLRPLLERLQPGCDGALALVSGRPLADIDALFRPLRLPAAGLHGWERRCADGMEATGDEPVDWLTPLRPHLTAFVAGHPGVLLEDKRGGLALHYRQASHHGAAVRRFARQRAAADPELRLIEGRKVVEFQPRGMDKGRAISAFLGEPPFLGRRPVYAGDDATDEDGFAVVNRMGGLSIRVLAPETRRWPSAAHYALPSVAAFHAWLGAVADRWTMPFRASGAERDEGAGTGAFVAR